jgi:hypothetical protein
MTQWVNLSVCTNLRGLSAIIAMYNPLLAPFMDLNDTETKITDLISRFESL